MNVGVAAERNKLQRSQWADASALAYDVRETQNKTSWREGEGTGGPTSSNSQKVAML